MFGGCPSVNLFSQLKPRMLLLVITLLIAVFLFFIATFTQGGIMKTQFAERPYKERATAEKELHRYIYNFDPRRDILPKDLNPSHVTDFVQQELQEKNIDSFATNQIVELADFYNLRGLVLGFFDLLNRKESTEEQFLISIAATRAIGILGQGEHLNQGVEYYRYLLGLQYSKSYLLELLRCYSDYSLVVPGNAISTYIKPMFTALDKEANGDPNMATKLREVEDLQNNVLPRILRAANAKRLILSEENTQNRLDRLVDIYLNLDTHYREWLVRWAVRQLLREFEENGSEELVKSFRRGLGRVQSMAPQEAIHAISASCFRAIDFFGGQLSESELKQAKSISGNVAGLLSLE
ncbi:hypothetical protein MNBD_GAMMA19-2 [hydrothermal vent metagenome]|uniref:Uncharacterized protein n=1 Tax=hydrothermal vent metagenome TaxID=652676 RepID=A0A3B1AKA0_9ZZZZ